MRLRHFWVLPQYWPQVLVTAVPVVDGSNKAGLLLEPGEVLSAMPSEVAVEARVTGFFGGRGWFALCSPEEEGKLADVIFERFHEGRAKGTLFPLVVQDAL